MNLKKVSFWLLHSFRIGNWFYNSILIILDDREVDRLLKDNRNEISSSSICHSSAYNEKQVDEETATNGKFNNSRRNIGMSRYTSFTSNNDDFSSSYDSQSEYERASSKNKQAFKDAIKRGISQEIFEYFQLISMVLGYLTYLKTLKVRVY